MDCSRVRTSTTVANTYAPSHATHPRKRGRRTPAAPAIDPAHSPPVFLVLVSEAVRTSSGSHAVAKLPPGVQLGDYVLGQSLWPLRIADPYRATGPVGACTVYIVHPQIAAQAAVRDH